MTKKPKIFFNPITQNLHKVVFLMDKIADAILKKKMQLTFSQFRILIVIYKHADITQAKIAKFHDLTRAAVKRQVNLLKNLKLLLIKKDLNKKQQILSLTNQGQLKITKALKELNKIFSEMYKILTKQEQKMLETSLNKLVEVTHNKAVKHF